MSEQLASINIQDLNSTTEILQETDDLFILMDLVLIGSCLQVKRVL